jgi:transketolase C-terminal domain/subunit
MIGGGRDRDYGNLGYTHWAEEDAKIMSVLNNIQTHRPNNNEEVENSFNEFLYFKVPSYMNLKK